MSLDNELQQLLRELRVKGIKSPSIYNKAGRLMRRAGLFHNFEIACIKQMDYDKDIKSNIPLLRRLQFKYKQVMKRVSRSELPDTFRYKYPGMPRTVLKFLTFKELQDKFKGCEVVHSAVFGRRVEDDEMEEIRLQGLRIGDATDNTFKTELLLCEDGYYFIDYRNILYESAQIYTDDRFGYSVYALLFKKMVPWMLMPKSRLNINVSEYVEGGRPGFCSNCRFELPRHAVGCPEQFGSNIESIGQ